MDHRGHRGGPHLVESEAGKRIKVKIPAGKPGHNFYLVAGSFKELGVKKVVPMHCSGSKAEEVFHETYQRSTEFSDLEGGRYF